MLIRATYKWKGPSCVTYGQTYQPAERLKTKMGRGLIVNFLGLGGGHRE